MPVVPKGNPNKHRLNTNGSVVDGDDELEVSNVSPPDVEIELARDDPSSPQRPNWVPDAEASHCYACATEFTLFRRRHHCRGCGRIFCAECCDRWLLLPPKYMYTDPERVCAECYREHSVVDHTRRFDEFGSRERPTLVLIHGAVCTRATWAPQTDALQEHYHLLVPDMPGHGSRVGEPLSMESAAEVLATLIREHANGGKAVVFGYSMGGYIAMAFAGRYPDLCAGLIVGGAATNMPEAKLMLSLLGVVYKLLPNKTKSMLVRDSASWMIGAQVRVEDMERCFLRAGANYEAWDQIKNLMAGENYVEHLQSYHGPVLFLNGSEDSREAEELWLEAANNGRLEVVNGATHLLTLDERYIDHVNRVVLEFANSIYNPAQASMKIPKIVAPKKSAFAGPVAPTAVPSATSALLAPAILDMHDGESGDFVGGSDDPLGSAAPAPATFSTATATTTTTTTTSSNNGDSFLLEEEDHHDDIVVTDDASSPLLE